MIATEALVTPTLRHADVVKLLSDPTSYPEPTPRIEVIETHISAVFLTDRFAYKLKKPVRFDFLDFSTPELRHTACRNEVYLNRRLAKDVYVGVVPITLADDGLRIDGHGVPVDWLVKMRLLPRERALDRLIAEKRLKPADIERIAMLLTGFYRQLPPLSIPAEDYRRHFEEHVLANRLELLQPIHGLDDALVKRIHAAQMFFLRTTPEVLDHRVCDGRVVDGHGDLRPEHIYLVRQPTIIDCIEFNPEFRQIDVLDELCFLAIECDLLGAREVGGQILDHYCTSSGDQPAVGLLPFYSSYRACVRAKVHALRAQQTSSPASAKLRETTGNYLRLAGEYASELGPPRLFIVHGLSGTGKSTLADALADSLGIEVLQTDRIRRMMFGKSDVATSYDADRYSPDKRAAVYDEMFRQAGDFLKAGLSVVLDGTFLSTKQRAQAMLLARGHGAIPYFVRCECPDEVAAERMSIRMTGETFSEAKPEFLPLQRAHREPDPPGVKACFVNTTESVPEILRRVYEWVKYDIADGRDGAMSSLSTQNRIGHR